MPEQRRVLVVEDDDDQREALAALVAACGFRVVACRSYEEASASLAADHPDVLITDVRLSERNGLQLVNLAALKYPDTMRVVLTGYDDIAYASFTAPPLTTVRQPARTMGEEAVRLLLARLEGDDAAPRRVVVEPDLRRRASTGPPLPSNSLLLGRA